VEDVRRREHAHVEKDAESPCCSLAASAAAANCSIKCKHGVQLDEEVAWQLGHVVLPDQVKMILYIPDNRGSRIKSTVDFFDSKDADDR
jgi:hypothetical protein